MISLTRCHAIYSYNLNAPSPYPHSVLQWLHSEEHILTAKVCAEAGSKKGDWYKLVATALATKPSDVVQQAIDFVRGQPMQYWYSELADCLTGKEAPRNSHR